MSCFALHDRLAVSLPPTPPDLTGLNSCTSPFPPRQPQALPHLSLSSSFSASGSSSRSLPRPPPPPSTSSFAAANRPGLRPPPPLLPSSLSVPERDPPQARPSSASAPSPPPCSSTSSAVPFRDVAWSKCFQQDQSNHDDHHPDALQPPISPPMSSHDHPPSPLPSAEPHQLARANTYQQQPQRVGSSPSNRGGPISLSSASSSSPTDTVALAAAAAAVAARVEKTSSASSASGSGGSTIHSDQEPAATEQQQQYPHQQHMQHHRHQKQHQQLPSLSSLFGPPSSERLRAPLLLLPSPLPPSFAQQQRQPPAHQKQQPLPQSQAYNHRPSRHDTPSLSEQRVGSFRPDRRLDAGLQHVAPSTEHWLPTAQKQPTSSSYTPLPAATTAVTPANAVPGRRRGSSNSSINEHQPLTPPLPTLTTTTQPVLDGSGSGSGGGLPHADGLGPKIWTGSQFLPRFVRTAEVPGEGLCHFYDDGSYCKTIIDGEHVNAHWGVTKAGKPRKRLAIACVLCREKKVKCDPDFPRCVQCQKFGRPCRFQNAPRGHSAVSPGATTPVWPAEDGSSVRSAQQQQQQQHDYNRDHDHDQTSKRMRTSYDNYRETGSGGGGSNASGSSSPAAMSTATVDSARPSSARSAPPLPPVAWAGQPPQRQQHPSPQSSYTHASAAAAAAADASYAPSSASSSASAAASAATSSAPSSYGAAHYRPPYPLSPVPSQPTAMDQQPRHMPSDLPRYHLPPPRSQPVADRPRLQDAVLRRPW